MENLLNDQEAYYTMLLDRLSAEKEVIKEKIDNTIDQVVDNLKNLSPVKPTTQTVVKEDYSQYLLIIIAFLLFLLLIK